MVRTLQTAMRRRVVTGVVFQTRGTKPLFGPMWTGWGPRGHGAKEGIPLSLIWDSSTFSSSAPFRNGRHRNVAIVGSPR